MTDEQRRRRIDEVCDAALAREDGDRAAFVAHACGDDDRLRQEVEALLAHAKTAERFLADPVASLAADVLRDSPTNSLLGRRIGSYSILSRLGAGGMGEVYRARDPKLERDVAIKVLPSSLAADPTRRARLSREARLLATLNHPHIAAVYGLEESAGITALVMELVEGATLAETLGQARSGRSKRPLSVPQTLRIARQIATALEAAHERGIVHRDLKPSNITIDRDGNVKVLDFGVAKTVSIAAPSDEPAAVSALDPHSSATSIAGTPAYMSPEQAHGDDVDKRTDVWAFGCVLYEMLAGCPAFQRENVPDTIAAVFEGQVDWDAMPPETPAPIRQLLRRCLVNDPKLRLRDIGDARIEIDEALKTPRAATIAAPPRRKAVRSLFLWSAVIAAVLLAAGLVYVSGLRSVTPSAPPLRLTADLGADALLATAVGLNADIGSSVALSPDGALFAFAARRRADAPPQLYVRRLDQLQATLLTGTEGATSPFFSPDGRWVAFFATGKLKKIAVTGGAPITLCDASNGRGASWGGDGSIVFTPGVNGPERFLWRVSAEGGVPEPLASRDDSEVTQRWPQMLPGSKAVLYTGNSNVGGYENANLVVQPFLSGPRKVVLSGGYYGRYLPSGHILYEHFGTLYAVPFDLDRLETTGRPVAVLEGVTSNPTTGATQFAVSEAGTIVYLPDQTNVSVIPIEFVDSRGSSTMLHAAPLAWSNPAFAPDGQRLALEISDGKQRDVWMYEWTRDALSRLTFDTADDEWPVWTPDSSAIVFSSKRAGDAAQNLYWQRADGAGAAQRLTSSSNKQYPASWHPSGRFLAFQELRPQTSEDVRILPMERTKTGEWKAGEPTDFVNSPFVEMHARFSPDGRWLAYASNESGRPEVYVRPFPGPGPQWQVSTDGGNNPTWSRTRRELLFHALDNRVMVASYAAADSFRAEKAVLWSGFRFRAREPRQGLRVFDLHPDGTRVAIGGVEEDPAAVRRDRVVFVFNFFDELRRVAPTGN